MIAYAITIHLLYAMTLLRLDDVALLSLLGGFQHLIDALGKNGTAALLIVVASVAAFGVAFEKRLPFWGAVGCLMPQFALLLYALISGLEIIITGRLQLDGTRRDLDRWLLAGGVGPICLAAFWHSLAIIQRFSNRQALNELEALRAQNRAMALELAQLKGIE